MKNKFKNKDLTLIDVSSLDKSDIHNYNDELRRQYEKISNKKNKSTDDEMYEAMLYNLVSAISESDYRNR